jgi:hypothetical protein
VGVIAVPFQSILDVDITCVANNGRIRRQHAPVPYGKKVTSGMMTCKRMMMTTTTIDDNDDLGNFLYNVNGGYHYRHDPLDFLNDSQ